MPIDLAIGEVIPQLEAAGLRPTERLAQNILRAGDAARTPLLALATDLEMLHAEPPRCYAPIHALRLLGELPDVEIMMPLLNQLAHVHYHEDGDPHQLWASEVPQIIARIGTPALEPLWAIADDSSVAYPTRSGALNSLVYLTAIAPDEHDAIAAGLRQRLEASDERTQTTALVIALANLGVGDAYPEIMARYRAGQIDTERFPAAYARQFLMSSAARRLACARHPLWERYDEHGPRPPEDAD